MSLSTAESGPLALAVMSNKAWWVDKASDVRFSPLLLCCVYADQCKKSSRYRAAARGSITLTLCALRNLISEGVISDRAAALTRYAHPEW